jgi:hypothetical protein
MKLTGNTIFIAGGGSGRHHEGGQRAGWRGPCPRVVDRDDELQGPIRMSDEGGSQVN